MVNYLATATVAASLLAAVPQAPQWQADYGKALEATRTDNRPLLVVLEEPTQPEDGVQPVAFSEDSDASKQAQLLQPYQLCRVDVSTEYGQQVAQAFGAKEFPYTAIIDKSGSVIIYSKTGKMDATQWKGVLTAHRLGDRTDVLVSSATSASGTSNVISTSHDGAIFQNPSQSYGSDSSYCPSCQKGYCASCQRDY